MARYLFAGGELVLDSAGNPSPGFAFTVYDDPFGGLQVTGFTTADGATPAETKTDLDGEIPWLRGPDGVKGPLYREMGTGTRSAWYSVEAIKAAIDAGAVDLSGKADLDPLTGDVRLDQMPNIGGGNTFVILGATTPRLNPTTGAALPAGASVIWVAETRPVNMVDPNDIWFNGPGN